MFSCVFMHLFFLSLWFVFHVSSPPVGSRYICRTVREPSLKNSCRLLLVPLVGMPGTVAFFEYYYVKLPFPSCLESINTVACVLSFRMMVFFCLVTTSRIFTLAYYMRIQSIINIVLVLIREPGHLYFWQQYHGYHSTSRFY